ncbi:MAG: xanthine dehydrogenase family protein molybdopterin-binding subunit [Spirosomataceae bacterium]
MKRRHFLRNSALSSTALILGIGTSGQATAAQLVNLGQLGAEAGLEVTPYVIIEKTGTITLMVTKPDMGQGTYQSLSAILADELDVALDKVKIEFTKGEKKFGDQTSGGSASVRGSYQELRKAGAAAREMFVKAAAQKWNVQPADCYTENGKVIEKTSAKSLSYNELVDAASKLEVPKEPQLKDPKNFKYIGKPLPRPDVPWKVTGKPIFGLDAEVPGMLIASVAHCPVFGGKVKSVNSAAAKAIKGVKDVVIIDRKLEKYVVQGASVAVVATNYWAALQGRKALKIEWDFAGNEQFNTTSYNQKVKQLANKTGDPDKPKGDFASAYASAVVKVEAEYDTPFLSHSPMEPQNALVWVKGDQVEAWVPSQGPDLVRDAISQHLNLKPENIATHICFSGGGFGRRLFPDVAVEAAQISQKLNAPVKVIWTREDDTSLGPFRPPTYSVLKAGLDANGKPIAFQHKVVSPSISDFLWKGAYQPGKPADEMMEAIVDMSYNIPNTHHEYVNVENHVPLGWWRAVTSTTTAFSHECFMDELAVKAGKDPIDFRLSLLTDEQRVQRAILEALKEKSGWTKPLAKGWARGVAIWEFFAGAAGHVVEVSKKADGKIKIERVFVAIHLGTVVNPETVKAQVEGGVVMGLTAALKDGITFENGRSVQQNFDTYRMTRIDEMPIIESVILTDNQPKINGVGEPGLPPLAPALANAIFNLTGKRIRKLPFDLENV